MFLEILIAIFGGVLTGIFTGITPGIHINLISALLLSSAAYLTGFFNPLSLAVFIISMSVTHSFLDCIPSIFLGAPDSATALGVLPGHRYLLRGNGMMAVKLTLLGSFGAMLLSIATFPVYIPIIKYGYPFIKGYIAYILIAVVLFNILRDKKKVAAAGVFLLSGILGLIVLNKHMENPLFPMLSGLFGISTLLISLKDTNSIPEQEKKQEIKIRRPIAFKALLSGQFSGFLTAVLPGLGASTAAVIALQITRKLGDHGFMVLMGAINTVNFILSMATLLVIDKARNGSIIAVQKLVEDGPIAVYLTATLVTGGISVFLVLAVGKIFARFVSMVNYRFLVTGIIALVTTLVGVMTGWFGLLVLSTSTAVGIIPAITKTTRTQAMGCLLLPVITYFI